jgi:hypothetical protein
MRYHDSPSVAGGRSESVPNQRLEKTHYSLWLVFITFATFRHWEGRPNRTSHIDFTAR